MLFELIVLLGVTILSPDDTAVETGVVAFVVVVGVAALSLPTSPFNVGRPFSDEEFVDFSSPPLPTLLVVTPFPAFVPVVDDVVIVVAAADADVAFDDGVDADVVEFGIEFSVNKNEKKIINKTRKTKSKNIERKKKFRLRRPQKKKVSE